jgi:hypothetical protein
MHRLFLVVILAFALTACAQEKNGYQGQHGDHHEHNDHQSDQKADVQAIWNFAAKEPKSHIAEELTIEIQDNQGKPIENFKMNHEKKMHLIVVSKDLSRYQHLHPEYMDKGIFKVQTNFPSGGDYKLIADFIPEDHQPKTQTHWVHVAGEQPAAEAIEPETMLTKTVEGKEVTLTFDKLQAGEEVTMNWFIKDANTKEPIMNLEQYLGAVGHVVILSADTDQYLHTHPVEERAKGPDAKFETVFPASGTYKLWGEFKHHGEVFIVPFTIEVP